MSLILDALRKSERTRQQTLTGQVSASGTPPSRARVPVPWATLIGLLLIANVIVLGIIFWRSHTNRAASVPVAAAPLSTAPASEAAPVYRPEVRSLAAEAAVGTPAQISTAPTPIATPSRSTQQPASATTRTVPAITSQAATKSPAANMIVLNASNPPPLDTLPLTFQQSLPPLHLDVHGYAQNPADRFVIINMQRYQKGDTLKEGPKVIEIVPEGVVLEYQGQQFLLPRP